MQNGSWILIHKPHPKDISFQDRHLLYLVRSLIFGSLFNWILLHVGQSSISTIHYDLVHGFSSASMFFFTNSLSVALWFSTLVSSSRFAKSFLRLGLVILEPWLRWARSYMLFHVLSFELILIGKVEKPYNQLKEHLEACLTKYSDLDSAVGPFFLINFCFLQVSYHMIFENCSICTYMIRSTWYSLSTSPWRDFFKIERQ